MEPDKKVEGLIKEIEDARRAAYEKTLPPGQTYEYARSKEIDTLRRQLNFLQSYLANLLSTEASIMEQITEIQSSTGQKLKEDELLEDIWILRYVFINLWFFHMIKPKTQNELDVAVAVALIDRSFEGLGGPPAQLTLLKNAFTEYTGGNKLLINELGKLESRVTNKIAEKVPLIAFNCTEGRLGGDLHDFVLQLVMTTITQDKQLFEGTEGSIRVEDGKKIMETIDKLKKSRAKVASKFLRNLFR